MWRLENLSIRQKLRYIVMIAVTAALLFACGAVLVYDQITARAQLRQDLEVLARIFADNSTAPLAFGDRAVARETLAALRAKPHILCATLYAEDGSEFASYRRNPGWQPVGNLRIALDSSSFVPGGLLVSQTVRIDGRRIGEIRIESDLDELNAGVRHFAVIVLASLIAAVAIAFLLSSRLQRYIVNPILHLGTVARDITEKGNYHLRAEKRSNDDLGRLTDAFNSMLIEIERRDQELLHHRDILEREVASRTADLVLARDQAQAASRAKSEFLANMSHELRTPMNGVLGMTSLVLESELTAEQREYLDVAHSSGSAMLALINDILDFSKIEAGRLELDPVSFFPRDHLAEATRSLAVQARQKGLEFLTSVDPAIPVAVVGDAMRLRQILVNLVGNALKFTSTGQVEVTLGLEPAATGVLLHYAVRDTGVGIPAAQQQSIFEAFSQADGSITRKFGGTGLGLTISSRLVAAMGGRIWIESESGQGSTFHFTMNLVPTEAASPANSAALPETASSPDHTKPLASLLAATGTACAAPEPTATGSAATVSLSPGRVLLVSSDPAECRLITEALAAWGFHTHAVADETAAFGLASRQPFSLLVADCTPAGLALVEHLRCLAIWSSPAMLLLPADGSLDHLTRAARLQVAALLPRPFRSVALSAALRRSYPRLSSALPTSAS